MLPALDAFAAAHHLTVHEGATRHAFVAHGEQAGRRATMAQGFIVHPRSGGKAPHFRLTFEPYVRPSSWMLTPTGVTRWAPDGPSPCSADDVPGHERFAEPLRAFADEVQTHWQLKLGEQERLYLEALETVSPRAWELAWAVLHAAWEAS